MLISARGIKTCLSKTTFDHQARSPAGSLKAPFRTSALQVFFYASRCDAAAVAMQELHRAFPSFRVLHALLESHVENDVFSNLSLQATHCQRPGFLETHALQTRSCGVLHAFAENSAAAFFSLHLQHSSSSGRAHAVQILPLGCVQARAANIAAAFFVWHLMHSRSSGRAHAVQMRSFGVRQAYAENSAAAFLFLHLQHSSSSGFTQALQILPSG